MKFFWTSVVILLSVQYCLSLRILGIFPLNGKSHTLIQQTIMKGLAARGHHVDVYSHFPLKKPPPNYTDYSLKGTMPSLLNNLTYDDVIQFQGTANVERLIALAGNPQCELLGHPIFENLLKNPPKYDIVFVEVFASNCHLAWGRHLKVPMIGVVCPGILPDWVNDKVGNPINLNTDVSFFSQNIPPLTFWERLENIYLTKSITYEAHHRLAKQNEYVEKFFGPGYPDVQEMLKDLSLIFLNYNAALNGLRTFAPLVKPTAGIHVVESSEDILPKEIQKFIDEAKDGFIYFTFGSMVRIETFPVNVVASFYEAFRKIAPVRVLMKVANADELPPGLPSNVLTQPWFSQVKVLKHKNIKLFITHGGLLGTQEAIYHGVPLLGIPLFGDQSFNLEQYMLKGIAQKVNLADVTEEKLTKVITEILQNPSYKKNVESLSRKFRDSPMSPMETAVFWTEYIARNGKDALRLPSLDLPWWQNNLLDVCGLILAVALAILFVIFRIAKCVICFACPHNSQASNSKLKKQ